MHNINRDTKTVRLQPKSDQHIPAKSAEELNVLLFDPLCIFSFRVWKHLSPHRRWADLLYNLRSAGDSLVRILAGWRRGPVGNYFWEGHYQSGEDDCGEKHWISEFVFVFVRIRKGDYTRKGVTFDFKVFWNKQTTTKKEMYFVSIQYIKIAGLRSDTDSNKKPTFSWLVHTNSFRCTLFPAALAYSSSRKPNQPYDQQMEREARPTLIHLAGCNNPSHSVSDSSKVRRLTITKPTLTTHMYSFVLPWQQTNKEQSKLHLISIMETHLSKLHRGTAFIRVNIMHSLLCLKW